MSIANEDRDFATNLGRREVAEIEYLAIVASYIPQDSFDENEMGIFNKFSYKSDSRITILFAIRLMIQLPRSIRLEIV